jgi:hypothetical protein
VCGVSAVGERHHFGQRAGVVQHAATLGRAMTTPAIPARLSAQDLYDLAVKCHVDPRTVAEVLKGGHTRNRSRARVYSYLAEHDLLHLIVPRVEA